MSAQPLLYAPDGTLRAPWRLAGFIALTLAFLLLFGGVIAVAARRPPNIAESSLMMIAALAASHAIMLRGVDRLPWSAVGLDRGAASLPSLASGLLLGALAIGVPSAVLLGVGLLDARPMPGDVGAWWSFAGQMALFLLPAALWEELAFRGYPFAVLRRAIGAPGALLVTSVLFGAAHAHNQPGAILPLVLVTLAGVFLGVILLATRSLWAAWMAHFSWNFVMAALLHTEVSGIPLSPPGYRVTDAGPDWLTGGSWGPEGGVPAGLGMIAVLAYLFARRTRATAATGGDGGARREEARPR
ncbi:MAG TPA: CPBP family intramembrane glutamic endopeptidase [Gemmatimonadaceae bacterium]|nr:CPBP family intramembrane glutamic endopeptidase [Gemmatimonadaceae bacterium]